MLVMIAINSIFAAYEIALASIGIARLDTLARGLKAAAALIEDGRFDRMLEERYAGWKEKGAAAMLSGGRTLEQIADWVVADNINPQPRSGQQELLENIVNRYV